VKDKIFDRALELGIIPVAVVKSEDKALALAKALLRGGIDLVEITLRTPCALNAIKLLCEKCPQIIAGAGTVLNAQMCNEAIDAGAKFIVSPGFGEDIAEVCENRDILYIPGCATPTEIMMALKCKINVVKYFPAKYNGGPAALKSIASAFPGVKFIPTGGIGENDLDSYLGLDCVAAVGGSWLCSESEEETAALSAAALKAVSAVRGEHI